MADNPNETDGEEQQTRFAEDLAPLVVSAYPDGEPSAFHTRNDPQDPFQRDNIIERKGKVDVRCEHKDIVHGFYSDEVDDPYSLIVLEFQFSPNGLARRIKEAHVIIKFASLKQGEPDPIVADIYPKGSFSVVPTKHHEKEIRGGRLHLGGGAAGAHVGGSLRAEHIVKRDMSDATTLRGSIDLRGRNWGDKNSVSWSFLENKTTKTGVVRSMQAAILLKRRDMENFKASITIDIDADTTTNMSAMFKGNPKDDDVWYDPNRDPPSTNRLQEYDINNLGTFPLECVSDVTFMTVLEDAVKEK